MQYEYDIAIIGGLGHIGLPLGILFADKFKNVLLVDNNLNDEKKVMKGKMPFIEYGADSLLKLALKRNLIHITSNSEEIKNAKNIIFCIGTPIDEYLNPKTNQFLDAISENSKFFNQEQLIIIRSYVFPGICSQVNKLLGPRINLSFCPERIVQGKSLIELPKLPQIVSGFTPKSIRESQILFSKISKFLNFWTTLYAKSS